MKAMVFAAGFGSRLRPITLTTPKPLIEVGAMTMLQRTLLRLKHVGVGEVVVNVHHLAEKIVDYLAENGNFGLDIHISDESDRILDTGGGLLKAARWLRGDESFFVHNADVLSDIDLDVMMRHHVASGADATLLVADRKSSRKLLFDPATHLLRGWTNLSTGETRPAVIVGATDPFAFGGIHILDPSMLDRLERYRRQIADEAFSITPFYIEECADCDISAFIQPSGAVWYDIGRHETLQAAMRHFGCDDQNSLIEGM